MRRASARRCAVTPALPKGGIGTAAGGDDGGGEVSGPNSIGNGGVADRGDGGDKF